MMTNVRQLEPKSVRFVLDALTRLDIPAKGRIAHHIRTGRINQALELCAAAKLFIWKRTWYEAKPILVDQLNLLKRVEMLLQNEVQNLKLTLNGEMI